MIFTDEIIEKFLEKNPTMKDSYNNIVNKYNIISQRCFTSKKKFGIYMLREDNSPITIYQYKGPSWLYE